ncbi:hypothetical protein [Streptomyces sp. NPDC101393]|uniref:hypothetical protein n=1 Tax=Streptomyces sp. NPDC101393 TaxID=3366141 RepID=UPI0038283727
MKQGTIKTLGAAALGAAFAVSAAGVASAAPSINAGDALHNLPVKDVTKTVSGAANSAKPATGPVKTKNNTKGNSLLGGLPTSAVTTGLPLAK